MGYSQPVFRVTRIRPDLWIVLVPGSPIEHSFAALEEATAFIRRESRYSSATIELRVDCIIAVAYLDPYGPQSLFGE
jgi:hypothetical protein